MDLLLAITSVNATFWLAILVLISAVGLSIVGALKAGDNAKNLFAVVGVLLGLFGAGGLGSLFASQVADEAAEKAAPEAAAAAVQLSEARAETASPPLERLGGSSEGKAKPHGNAGQK